MYEDLPRLGVYAQKHDTLAMKIIILRAGTIGICTAWHLLKLGHEVTVVERQHAAALGPFKGDAPAKGSPEKPVWRGEAAGFCG
jgi:hypothetical protein